MTHLLIKTINSVRSRFNPDSLTLDFIKVSKKVLSFMNEV